MSKNKNSFVKKQITNRGFGVITFTDRYGSECTLQDSSLATEPAIWFGPKECLVQVLEPHKGWKTVELPKESVANQRMHLTQDMVKELLPFLTRFAETGEYLTQMEKFESLEEEK